MDEDLDAMTAQELRAEVLRLRDGIRRHRDADRHDLCWHHPELWGLLPEPSDPVPHAPPWPEFLQGCIAYRQSLERPLVDAPRRTDTPHPGSA